MKALITLITGVVITTSAQAKISDFNALIDENSAAQTQLHKELKTSAKETAMALKGSSDFAPQVVVDDRSDSISVPTKKNLLRFKKEVVRHGTKSKEIDKRIANEFRANEF